MAVHQLGKTTGNTKKLETYAAQESRRINFLLVKQHIQYENSLFYTLLICLKEWSSKNNFLRSENITHPHTMPFSLPHRLERSNSIQLFSFLQLKSITQKNMG
uniref:Uncharacterized protein n=1 Tax=Rhizophora mucronata TaxID=61149 RepID=A0A2P2LP11_RHIMU